MQVTASFEYEQNGCERGKKKNFVYEKLRKLKFIEKVFPLKYGQTMKETSFHIT